MSGEVTILPKPQDHVAANRANLRAAWRRRRTYRTWFGMIALLAAVGAVLGAIMDGEAGIVPLALGYAALGLVLIPVLLVLVYVFVAPRRIKRLVRQQSSASLAQSWRWSDGGLEVENAQGLSRHSWTDLFGWRETEPSLLLYLNDRMFYALPRHAVAVKDWTDLIGTVRRSGLAIY